MKHFFATAAITVAASVGTLCAGTIVSTQIGGVNGLTDAYILNSADNPNLITGQTGNFYEKNYDNRLFQAATTPDPTNNAPSPTPYSTYLSTTSVQGSLASSGLNAGVTFSMINDGCTDASMSINTPTRDACPTQGGPNDGANFSSNAWMGTSQGTLGNGGALIIPIGIFDVTDVDTMLNNLYGQAGAQDSAITFTFGASSNDTSGDTVTLTLNLTNSTNNSSNSGSGQIGTSLECTGVGTCKDNASISYATGPLATSSSITALDSLGSMQTVNVTTGSAYSGNFNNATGNFLNHSGQIVLSDQDFQVPLYTADPWLVSVIIQELNGATNVSATTLSAITVESVTPEPSTVFLMVLGLGAIALASIRRRRAAAKV